MKRFLCTALFAMSLSAGVAGAAGIYIHIGPPPRVREVVIVRPSPQHVWQPGYHHWNGSSYVWTSGSWVTPPRPRAHWVPGRWNHQRQGYVWVEGRWR